MGKSLSNLTNLELLQLFACCLRDNYEEYALEVREEIFMRMEGEGE